ncbi:nuclear transport factor 2 family protein [Streptomyces fumanus]|uniref:nuclear transport factor 2 family protein n=1 Tax=Streptomyces fumanus TaxID=67302 RepID=UPI0033CB5401
MSETEMLCKHLVVEHCRRINAGDLEGLLALYSPAVTYEDPVGTGPRSGIEALRAHAGAAIECHAYEDFGAPVAAQDGATAAVPVVTTMNYLPWGPNLVRLGYIPAPPEEQDGSALRIRFDYVMAVKVGADGLINDMRGYWGRSDVVYLGPAEPAEEKVVSR